MFEKLKSQRDNKISVEKLIPKEIGSIIGDKQEDGKEIMSDIPSMQSRISALEEALTDIILTQMEV